MYSNKLCPTLIYLAYKTFLLEKREFYQKDATDTELGSTYIVLNIATEVNALMSTSPKSPLGSISWNKVIPKKVKEGNEYSVQKWH